MPSSLSPETGPDFGAPWNQPIKQIAPRFLKVGGFLLLGGVLLLGISVVFFFGTAIAIGFSSASGSIDQWANAAAAVLLVGGPVGLLAAMLGGSLLLVGFLWSRAR